MRTLDQLTALTLGTDWEKGFDCLRMLARQRVVRSGDRLEVLAEHPLPPGLRAYNLARLGNGLCLTTHMGEKRLLFMDAAGRFEVGPACEAPLASMVAVVREGRGIVLGAIGGSRLLHFSASGEPLGGVDLDPERAGLGVWRMCDVGDQVLVVCKGGAGRQELVLADAALGRTARIDCAGLLSGVTNRVRHHGGRLYFLQNNGPHVLVARLDSARARLELEDVRALHGCSPMGFDVSEEGIVLAWNDRIMRLDEAFAPTFSAQAHGFESMDVLHAHAGPDTFWLRNQDYSALLLARLRPAGVI